MNHLPLGLSFTSDGKTKIILNKFRQRHTEIPPQVEILVMLTT